MNETNNDSCGGGEANGGSVDDLVDNLLEIIASAIAQGVEEGVRRVVAGLATSVVELGREDGVSDGSEDGDDPRVALSRMRRALAVAEHEGGRQGQEKKKSGASTLASGRVGSRIGVVRDGNNGQMRILYMTPRGEMFLN